MRKEERAEETGDGKRTKSRSGEGRRRRDDRHDKAWQQSGSAEQGLREAIVDGDCLAGAARGGEAELSGASQTEQHLKTRNLSTEKMR